MNDGRTVGTMGKRELGRLMRSSGVYVQIGPFLLNLRSRIPSVIENFSFLYRDYPVFDEGIADFHVRVDRPPGLRRWVARQAVFLLHGQMPFQPFPERLGTPLFEWGLNWCVSMHAHQFLVIHAAVMERDGFAMILPGPPGSGKSTLCAALIHDGWRLLSDEHALIRLADRMVVPVPRPISLKNASIEIVRGFSERGAIGPVFTETRKGSLAHLRAPANSIARRDEPARPVSFVFVQYRASDATTWERQDKGPTFFRLAENSFNYQVLGREGFDALADLVDGCGHYELVHRGLEEAKEAIEEIFVESVREQRARNVLSTRA